jgi:phage shock protein PspC (stress-responsive transcriptional regulator)
MKRLYRSLTNRNIAGVCGGMGDYLGVDPTIIRILWVFALFATCFAAFFAYLVAWAIIPEEPRGE